MTKISSYAFIKPINLEFKTKIVYSKFDCWGDYTVVHVTRHSLKKWFDKYFFEENTAIILLLFIQNKFYIVLNIFSGARKWLASLDFDADSFKAAIVNIYPRLATVSSYSLWNVKPDKTLEKLPCMVNTPKRIKAYLGATFTGSLVIMPSEEISLVS